MNLRNIVEEAVFKIFQMGTIFRGLNIIASTITSVRPVEHVRRLPSSVGSSNTSVPSDEAAEQIPHGS